jgi:hypothetical protein
VLISRSHRIALAFGVAELLMLALASGSGGATDVTGLVFSRLPAGALAGNR